jgi:hypothetical protein
MVTEALTETQDMLVRLHKHVAQSSEIGTKPGKKYGMTNKENKTKQDAEFTWREALEDLLQGPQESSKNTAKDECALVLGCLCNVASIAPKDVALDTVCGQGCLAWAKSLAAEDQDTAARLCSNMYKACTKAGGTADARAKEVKQGSLEHAHLSASAIILRTYSVRHVFHCLHHARATIAGVIPIILLGVICSRPRH